MAVANQLSAVVPKLLAQGLLALRENAVMPRLVNLGYSTMAGEKGSTIEVPIPSAITAQSVTSAAIAPDSGDLLPTSISIPMDQWYEASFTLSDKELLEVQNGTIPMQASEAVRALANKVDNYMFDLWYKIPYIVGAQTGGTPFNPTTVSASDARTLGMTDVTNVMTTMNKTLSPMGDRRFVVDPIAYGNLIQMRAFQDVGWGQDVGVILEGRLSRKLGFDWFMSQNLPRSHVWGAGITGGDALGVVAADTAAGANSVTVTAGSGETIAFKKGDAITFTATGAGVYTVTADVSIAATTSGAIPIYPNLRVALADGTPGPAHSVSAATQPVSTTLSGTDAVCLAFHRDAFAFASRPLQATDMGLGVPPVSAVDPVSGLSLRLEVTREFKRTRFSYDILFGAQLVRPELACRYQY